MDKLRAVFGHPIYKEYEVGRQVASGGPGCLWRIHEGTQRSRKEVWTRARESINYAREGGGEGGRKGRKGGDLAAKDDEEVNRSK